MQFTHVVELGTVFEHEQDISHKLLRGKIVCVAVSAEPVPDDRQIHGLLDDLIIMTGLYIDKDKKNEQI